MKILKTFSLLSIINLLFFSCNLHNNDKDALVQIEAIDTYTNSDLWRLIGEADSIINSRNKGDSKTENSYPLISVLSHNVKQDINGNWVVSISSVFGYALTTDTSKVIKLLNQSGIFPKDIKYEWLPSGNVPELLSLIALKKNGSKVTLENKDIESIVIAAGDASQVNGIEGLQQYLTSSIRKVNIYLNEKGIDKIKQLKNDDAVLLRININKRNFIVSQIVEQIGNGITLDENITKEFTDSIRLFYPSLTLEE